MTSNPLAKTCGTVWTPAITSTSERVCTQPALAAKVRAPACARSRTVFQAPRSTPTEALLAGERRRGRLSAAPRSVQTRRRRRDCEAGKSKRPVRVRDAVQYPGKKNRRATTKALQQSTYKQQGLRATESERQREEGCVLAPEREGRRYDLRRATRSCPTDADAHLCPLGAPREPVCNCMT